MTRTVAIMRASLPPLLLGLTLGAMAAMAADLRHITLADGSVINGEVIEMKDGVYVIHSATLGTMRLTSAEVRGIEAPGAAPATGGTSPAVKRAQGRALENVEERLANDSEMVDRIAKLQDDPKFKDILNDKDIMNAIQSGDTDALQANPKIRDLMDHPAVGEINRKLGQ